MTELITTWMAEHSLLVALIVTAFLPNEIWRWAGLIASTGLSADSEILIWVRYVATAIVAALVARLVFDPPGVLADVPMIVRVLSMMTGIFMLLVSGRNLLIGILSGVAALAAFQHFEVFA